MICPKCGNNINNNSKFCENCGAPLNEVQPIIQSEQQPEVQPIIQPEQQPEVQPIIQPEQQPEVQPIIQSEQQPEVQPIIQPEQQPEVQPIIQPEQQPEVQPIIQPKQQPEVQPIIQPEQQPMYQQPINNQPQPMYQQPMYNQPQPMYQQPIKNKKSSNTILIVIIVLLFIVAGVVLGIYFTKDNKSNNTENKTNENEYENNNVKTTSTTKKDTSVNNNDEKINYSGYDFEKLPNHKYKDAGTYLAINVSNKVLVEVHGTGKGNINEIIAEKDSLKDELEKNDYIVSNYKNSKYKGTNIISYEIKLQDNKEILFYVAETSVKGYLISGYVYNNKYKIDYTTLNDVATIAQSISLSSSSFSNPIDKNEYKININENNFE